MKFKPLLAAFALVGLLAASEARASFTYSVLVVPTNVLFGNSNMQVTSAFNPPATSGVLAGTQTINLAQVFQSTTTAPPATDVTSFGITLTVTINNQNGGGSGNFAITGTINVTRSDTAGANSNFVLTNILPASLPLGPFVYSLGAITYTAPTIGGGGNANGGISILINEIPEPTSVVLMGLGVVGLGGLGVYRRRRDA